MAISPHYQLRNLRVVFVCVATSLLLAACTSVSAPVDNYGGDNTTSISGISTNGSGNSGSGNSSQYAITYPAMPLAANLEQVRVSKVVDGDTFDVILGAEVKRIRLIGINTPETVDPRRPVQCFGLEASTRAKALLVNQTVYLEIDPASDTIDQYGRLLRFAWFADGRLFNMQMVAEGYASEYTYQGTRYKYQAQFKVAQRTASQEGRGLWSPSTCNGDFNKGVK